jgi:hypothetical protein
MIIICHIKRYSNALVILQHLSPSRDSTDGGCEDEIGHDDVVPKESHA